MKIPKLEKYIFDVYRAGDEMGNGRSSILVLGLPGIGKSWNAMSAAKKIAEYKKREFILYDDVAGLKMLKEPDKYFYFLDLRLTHHAPEDLSGIPRERENFIMYLPLLWTEVASKIPGVILLDEITNERRENMLAAAYGVVYDRIAGFKRFHPDTMIIACGNRPEESSIASELPSPLINRFIVVNVEPASVDEWRDFMYRNYGEKWDMKTYAFLKRFESEGFIIQVPKTPETLKAYPTHRSWTVLSRYRYYGITDSETIYGCIGEEVGAKFEAFLQVNVDIEELINNPLKFKEISADAKYMASVMLSSWVRQHFKKAGETLPLFDVMFNESREYVTVFLMGIPKNTLKEYMLMLLKYNNGYFEAFKEVFIDIAQEIKA